MLSFKGPNLVNERVNGLADEKMILAPFGVIVEGAVVTAIIQVDAHYQFSNDRQGKSAPAGYTSPSQSR